MVARTQAALPMRIWHSLWWACHHKLSLMTSLDHLGQRHGEVPGGLIGLALVDRIRLFDLFLPLEKAGVHSRLQILL